MTFWRILWEWLTFKWLFRGLRNSSGREEIILPTHNHHHEDYHDFPASTTRSNHSGFGSYSHSDYDYDYTHEDIDDTDINDDCDFDY